MLTHVPVLLLGGALLFGAALVLTVRPDGAAADPLRNAAASHAAKVDALRDGPRARSARAALAREIRALSAREVRDQLPLTANYAIFQPGKGADSERVRLLFQRFGKLEGESALDELLSRYGPGSFTGQAMAMAIVGWMESEPTAALAAFQSMTSNTGAGPGLFLPTLNWKGTPLISGLG